jgi:isopentenyl-diphosphate delta-isomerase
MDELLDLVDLNDQVIEQKLRSEVYAQKLNNFRVVNLFLINEQGQLWIPRRTAHKKLFPLSLDTSMGGHVSAGENYELALKRELQEELRIELAQVTCQMIGKLNPQKHGTSAFMQVYLIRTNNTPDYNQNDFCESFWLTPNQLLNWIDQGEPCKGDLPIIVRQLFS